MFLFLPGPLSLSGAGTGKRLRRHSQPSWPEGYSILPTIMLRNKILLLPNHPEPNVAKNVCQGWEATRQAQMGNWLKTDSANVYNPMWMNCINFNVGNVQYFNQQKKTPIPRKTIRFLHNSSNFLFPSLPLLALKKMKKKRTQTKTTPPHHTSLMQKVKWDQQILCWVS